MTRVGGLTKKFYKETKGVKVSGGQTVKCGALLTRSGDRWKPGSNVTGRMHLTAACDGEVYFTKKKGNYRRVVTFINIRPINKTNKKTAKSEIRNPTRSTSLRVGPEQAKRAEGPKSETISKSK